VTGVHQQALSTFLVKQTLHELNVRYCSAIDRLDEEAFVTLFHHDALIDSGVVRGSPRPFAREFIDWVRGRARVIAHQITNEHFEIAYPSARAECSVIAISRLLGEDQDTDALTFGRYLDHFEEREGSWRFLRRRFVLDHSVAWPSKAALPTAGFSPMARGAFGRDDPSYAFWAGD
jgi:hypothetical protein